MVKRQCDSTEWANVGVSEQNPKDDPTLIMDQSCLIGILVQGLKFEHFDAHSCAVVIINEKDECASQWLALC